MGLKSKAKVLQKTPSGHKRNSVSTNQKPTINSSSKARIVTKPPIKK